MIAIVPGLAYHPGFLDRVAQNRLAEAIDAILAEAPPFRPTMPRTGTPFSVRMSNCGPLGWVSDVSGYRYQPNHPDTDRPWPAMPPLLAEIWNAVSGYAHPAEACLINLYETGARMGLHQDRDEQTFEAPVVSVSLGDTGSFRVGGLSRKDPTRSFRLSSGDVMVLGGPARLAFHGIDRILPGTSTLLSGGGRINLTLRRVTRPTEERRPSDPQS